MNIKGKLTEDEMMWADCLGSLFQVSNTHPSDAIRILRVVADDMETELSAYPCATDAACSIHDQPRPCAGCMEDELDRRHDMRNEP